MSPVLINPYRRGIRCPGFLGARLKGASVTSAGVGDCIFIDYTRSCFAVADASDRNTSASREFLILFSEWIRKIYPHPCQVVDAKDIASLKKKLADESRNLLAHLPFWGSTTFTGILLVPHGNGKTGIVLHTGDSLLLRFDPGQEGYKQITDANFWMVGRTERFFQIEELLLEPETRLLLATDGIREVPAASGYTREQTILNLFQTGLIEDLPDRLLSSDSDSIVYDDVALVAIHPWAASETQGTFIVGGSSKREEVLFEAAQGQGLEDRYIRAHLSENDSISGPFLIMRGEDTRPADFHSR